MVAATAVQVAIVSLRRWLTNVQPSTAAIIEEDSEVEFVANIRPTNRDASPLTVRIGKSDQLFDCLAGRAVQINDLNLDTSLLLDICEAVRQGQVVEETWERNGKVMRSIGRIQLPTRALASQRVYLPRLVAGRLLGYTRHQYKFHAW